MATDMTGRQKHQVPPNTCKLRVEGGGCRRQLCFTFSMAIIQNIQIINAGEGVKEGEPSYTVDGNAN